MDIFVNEVCPNPEEIQERIRNELTKISIINKNCFLVYVELVPKYIVDTDSESKQAMYIANPATQFVHIRHPNSSFTIFYNKHFNG